MRLFWSFYTRLSALFLVTILLLGIVSLTIAFTSSRYLFDEVEQLINREYAGSIASELQPLVQEGFSQERIQDAIHYMMVLNPMVEIYLLSPEGKILAFFTHPAERLLRNEIDTDPLERFISARGLQPVTGDDPRTTNRKKPFSAAPLRMGEERGFVYVILRGQSYDSSFARLGNDYYVRTGLITFLISFVVAIALGLLLFFLLTRRLTELSQAVKRFERGDYGYRIPVRGRDEVTDLGRAFNEMARSIQDGIGKLQQAERQRSDLIANVSHDLRSPLTSIRGHLETMLLKDETLTPERRREFLEITLKNVSSFQKLVEELFDLAKLESRQVHPRLEPFSLAELAQDVALKRSEAARRKNIEIAYAPEENLPPVPGDVALLERVITNVLDNALAHTPTGGTISIRIGDRGGAQALTVRDTGPGIDAKDLPHIFERFYRADKSRNRDTPGTGLGLAIAREIVELHRGEIAAESPAEGGALFTIILPVA